MSTTDVTHYRLTPAARQDLEQIWTYSARTWGAEQADQYLDALERSLDTLVSMPDLARERSEFTPPVRIHPTAQHLIVYVITKDHLAVLRVLGGRQNWRSVLEMDE